MLSMLTIAAVNATASDDASAAACVKTAGTKFALCLGEPLVLTEGSFTIRDETDTPSEYILKSPATTVVCDKVSGLGRLNAASGSVTISNLKLEFTVCGVHIPAGCTVKAPITTEFLKGVIESLQRGKLLVTPQTGEAFVAIKFENQGGEECLIAGSDIVKLLAGGKGGVLCIASLETTKLLQLATCSKANSDLEYKKEAGAFEGNFNTKLLSKTGVEEKWAIIEGT